MGMVKVIAPAKVNLYLGVGQCRADGYHDVDTIMHALSLHDTLTIACHEGIPGEGLQVEVSCTEHGGIAPLEIPAEDNIVYKTAHALAAAFGRTADEQVRIAIDKEIPHGAGLGGGSSDAAATIVGLCSLWGEEASSETALNVAAAMGADVAFFLHGGCARMSGTGASFEKQLAPARSTIVIVRPEEGVSTAAAYRAFDESPVVIDDGRRRTAASADAAGDVPLTNNLASAAEGILPELEQIREWLSSAEGVACNSAGEAQVLLCGSGSSTFAVCDGFDAAYRLCGEARNRGWWARSTNLSAVRAAVLPRAW